MLRFVSSIKEHITTTEFWRALSFVLKRLENIAKYLTQLPLPLTFSLYVLHLIRAGLRIFSFFYQTKNKNLGDTCKFLFATFKVSIAIIALVLLGCGVLSLPSVLLSSFFAYSILKLIHSAVVLFVSTIYYLKIDKYGIKQRFRRAQYRDNMSKHACMLGTGLLFLLVTSLLISAGTGILIGSSPLFLLLGGVICAAFLAATAYLASTIAKNKRISAKNLLEKEQISQFSPLKKFLLLFGLGIAALLLTATAPWLGASVLTVALILLSAQDVLLTIYYYFYGVYLPNPEPANLSEAQLNADIEMSCWDYYHVFSPILYLQTAVSEQFQSLLDVNKTNKKMLLKVTFMKLLQIDNKLEKIAESGAISQFFSSQKKLTLKKDYLVRELAWALNTDDQDVLIDLFILAIVDIPANKRAAILEDNLYELLALLAMDHQPWPLASHHGSLEKNSLGQLFFLAKQAVSTQQIKVIKPKLFYQSFWKKVGACDALSQAFQASRNIEEQISLSKLS